MARRDWENALLRQTYWIYADQMCDEFEAYLKDRISYDEAIKRCFNDYTDFFHHLCVDAAKTEREEARAVSGELTNERVVAASVEEIRLARRKLRTMSDQALSALYRQNGRAEMAIRASREEALGRRSEYFEFFNDPAADANFAFWLKVEHWAIEEAVALSLGKNPQVVSSSTLSTSDEDTPFRAEYRKRLFFLERAHFVEDSGVPILRDRFIQWFAHNGIEVPPELNLRDKEYSIEFWKNRCLELEATYTVSREILSNNAMKSSKKTRNGTLYRIALGVALCAYGHVHGGYGPAATAIERDLKMLRDQSDGELDNIEVGDDTIRGVLIEAAEFLGVTWVGELDPSLFEAWKFKNRGVR